MVPATGWHATAATSGIQRTGVGIDAGARRGYRTGVMAATELSCAELVTLLSEELDRAGAEPIVASDGDFTLWDGDIGEALFEAALDERVLRPAALEPLRAEAKRHGLRADGDSNDVGRVLLDAHRAGDYPNAPAFAMMAWAFAGFGVDEMRAFAEQVIDAFGLQSRLRAELEPMRAWCVERGVPLWLVSASPLAVAEVVAGRMGIEHVVAMTPRVEEGIVVAALDREPTYAEGKVNRLRQHTAAPILAAFGDSEYDGALLDAATLAVAVHPSAALRRRVDHMDRAFVVNG